MSPNMILPVLDIAFQEPQDEPLRWEALLYRLRISRDLSDFDWDSRPRRTGIPQLGRTAGFEEVLKRTHINVQPLSVVECVIWSAYLPKEFAVESYIVDDRNGENSRHGYPGIPIEVVEQYEYAVRVVAFGSFRVLTSLSVVTGVSDAMLIGRRQGNVYLLAQWNCKGPLASIEQAKAWIRRQEDDPVVYLLSQTEERVVCYSAVGACNEHDRFMCSAAT